MFFFGSKTHSLHQVSNHDEGLDSGDQVHNVNTCLQSTSALPRTLVARDRRDVAPCSETKRCGNLHSIQERWRCFHASGFAHPPTRRNESCVWPGGGNDARFAWGRCTFGKLIDARIHILTRNNSIHDFQMKKRGTIFLLSTPYNQCAVGVCICKRASMRAPSVPGACIVDLRGALQNPPYGTAAKDGRCGVWLGAHL